MRVSRFGFAIFILALYLAAPGRAIAQSSDDLNALNQQAKQLYEEGKYADALDVHRRVTTEIEKAEVASNGAPGRRIADALGSFAWYALFARCCWSRRFYSRGRGTCVDHGLSLRAGKNRA